MFVVEWAVYRQADNTASQDDAGFAYLNFSRLNFSVLRIYKRTTVVFCCCCCCLFVCCCFFVCLFVFSFPSYGSGVHHFWVRFLRMWPFLNRTIKVVTFRLRGWCVLGVFLLPAFTRLGHERQDLLSPCDEMHVCTD